MINYWRGLYFRVSMVSRIYPKIKSSRIKGVLQYLLLLFTYGCRRRAMLSFLQLWLCHLLSIAAHSDHFVRRLSVSRSASHTFLVVTHSYVSQATHAFLAMLPLCSAVSTNYHVCNNMYDIISDVTEQPWCSK